MGIRFFLFLLVGGSFGLSTQLSAAPKPCNLALIDRPLNTGLSYEKPADVRFRETLAAQRELVAAHGFQKFEPILHLENPEFFERVKWLTPEQCELHYRLRIGLTEAGETIFKRPQSSGDLVATTEPSVAWRPGRENWALFVLTESGLYISNYQERGRFHHVSFFRDKAVFAAGEIGIVDGKVVFVGNRSGHFPYGSEMIAQVFIALERLGFSLEGIQVGEIQNDWYMPLYTPFPASNP